MLLTPTNRGRQPKLKKNIDLIVYHHKHATKFPFLCDCSIARSVGPYTLILLPRGGKCPSPCAADSRYEIEGDRMAVQLGLTRYAWHYMYYTERGVEHRCREIF
jgi:hypothetical protein